MDGREWGELERGWVEVGLGMEWDGGWGMGWGGIEWDELGWDGTRHHGIGYRRPRRSAVWYDWGAPSALLTLARVVHATVFCEPDPRWVKRGKQDGRR